MSMNSTIANISYEAILAAKEDIERTWEMKDKYPGYDTFENIKREASKKEKLIKFTAYGPKSDPVKILLYMMRLMIDQVKLLDGLTKEETRDSLIEKAISDNESCAIGFMYKFINRNNTTNHTTLTTIKDSKAWFSGAILNDIKDYVGEPAEHIALVCRDIYIDFIKSLNMVICEFIYMKHIKIDKSMIFGFFVQSGITNYLLSDIDGAVPTITPTKKTPKETKNTKEGKEGEVKDEEEVVETDETEEIVGTEETTEQEMIEKEISDITIATDTSIDDLLNSF